MDPKKVMDSIEIGAKESFTKTVTETDVNLFAGITGDFYPLHVDEEFAKKTQFRSRIAHGSMLVGFISTVMAKMNTNHIPPPGGVSYRYDVKFAGPVMFGDTITTELTLKEKHPEKNEVIFDALCTNQRGETVLKGMTIMKLLKDPPFKDPPLK